MFEGRSAEGTVLAEVVFEARSAEAAALAEEVFEGLSSCMCRLRMLAAASEVKGSIG